MAGPATESGPYENETGKTAAPGIDRILFAACVVLIVGACVPMALFPEQASVVVTGLYDWIAGEIGILYQWMTLAATIVLGGARLREVRPAAARRRRRRPGVQQPVLDGHALLRRHRGGAPLTGRPSSGPSTSTRRPSASKAVPPKRASGPRRTASFTGVCRRGACTACPRWPSPGPTTSAASRRCGSRPRWSACAATTWCIGPSGASWTSCSSSRWSAARALRWGSGRR